jgi:galacturonosyltransferase
MREKGIDQYLEVAEAVKASHPDVEFHVCGFCEPEYDGRLRELDERGTIQYHGMVRDVSSLMGEMHCVVHPTYYPEGLSNVLLEACATGRPIITTNRPGCREVVEDGVNGYVVRERDSEDLVKKIESFFGLPNDEQKTMGQAGRVLVEQRFDRGIVVEAYMREIEAVSGTL